MDNIKEAYRYLNNAKDILSTKAEKQDGFYQDKKYVRLAGHAAYMAVLVALDELLGKETKGRKSAKWYEEQLTKLDKKALNLFNYAYDTLHLAMAYDGNQDAGVSQAGLNTAERIISWVETKLELQAA